MPEGDTVWRTARSLDRALTGAVLTESDFRVPSYATLDLTGRRIVQTVARGKHLLTRISSVDDAGEAGTTAELTLHTHLKMEGSWHLYRGGSRWRRPDHQARVVLRTAEWTAVGFSLGITEVLATADEPSVVGHLGPDLLGPDWHEAEAVRRLRDQPRRPIGEALLDQRNLAGIGNMYMAETLFLAGVQPVVPVEEVPDLVRVVRLGRRLLVANKERATQATTGNLRRGQQLWVYARGGQPCRRCRTPVESMQLGVPPQDRVTYWCPTCQPRTPLP